MNMFSVLMNIEVPGGTHVVPGQIPVVPRCTYVVFG